MELILFTAGCKGVASNCRYPNRVVVTNAEEMAKAISFDHVSAEYKGYYRKKDNFIKATGFFFDCDNDHSENPSDWYTDEMLEDIFSDVNHVITHSRHHLLKKSEKSARPRQHIYFPCDEYTAPELYAAIKRAIQKKYPYLDDNALDAARFFFGSDTTAEEIIWHEGWLNIDETLDESDKVEVNDEDELPDSGCIPEGSRNNTMSRFAARILKKYGICDKAYTLFLERAEKCEPPLADSELNTIWQSAVRFIKKVQEQPGYVPPEEFNADFKDENLKPNDYSDLGEAKVVVREYGNELKFTSASDFMRYDGRRWVENKQLAFGAIEEFMDLQLQDALDEVKCAKDLLLAIGIPKETIEAGGNSLIKALPQDKIGLYYNLLGAQTYLKFAMKYRSYKNMSNVQAALKPMVLMEISDFDVNPVLLNTPNGTYNLADGVANKQEHNPTDYITKVTNCEPSNKGEALWKEALKTFFCGDVELIEYVHKIVGLAAIGKVYQEHMIIAYGGGANGKSTFWNTIFRVLGSYAGKISADALTMNCKRNVKPEMAELKGKRLIIASEMEEGVRLNTSMVKQLCSTDEVQAEKKYKDPFHYTPSHTLVLYTNHLPRVGANDDGIWRRLIVVPFNAKLIGSSDKKNYADYLYKNAGPAVMKWVIEGAKTAIACDYKTDLPKVVEDAIERYRESNDWLGHFINEHCDVDKSYSEKSGELYQAYRTYCIANGEFVRSTTDFYGALEKNGFIKRRTKAGSIVSGLKLKDGQDFLE